jgi:hypothetical protein
MSQSLKSSCKVFMSSKKKSNPGQIVWRLATVWLPLARIGPVSKGHTYFACLTGACFRLGKSMLRGLD